MGYSKVTIPRIKNMTYLWQGNGGTMQGMRRTYKISLHNALHKTTQETITLK